MYAYTCTPTLTRCLPASPTTSEWLCHKPVKWQVTEPTNRCRQKYGRTTAVRSNRSEISLSPPHPPHMFLQECHNNRRNTRNTLNYWSRADASQPLYTQTATGNCIRDPEGPAGWWLIPSDTVSATVNTRGIKKGGGGVLTLIDWQETAMCEKTATRAQHYKNEIIRDAINCNQTRHACLTCTTSQMCDDLRTRRKKNFRPRLNEHHDRKTKTLIFHEFIQLWVGSVTDPPEI